MRKTLNLEIDRASWRSAPARKRCPFKRGQTRTTIDFLASLLFAGTAGISIQMPQWWLASQWAMLRYFGAADHSTGRLRLHKAADDLETHAKKVLSDDWGVGISLQWLTSRLRYRVIGHAGLVMNELKRAGDARFKKKPKRGPEKCPDFFAVDARNKIHIIECKANQEGLDNTLRQFADGKPQKLNITFSRESLVGQRLLCGVAIAGHRSRWQSTISIADPPSDDRSLQRSDESTEAYEIFSKSPDPMIRSVNKVSLIQGLLLAGAFDAARRVFPNETDTADIQRTANIELGTFIEHRQKWRGQVRELRYPLPVRLLDGSSVSGSRLRLGVANHLLERLSHRDASTKIDSVWSELKFDIRLAGDSAEASDEEDTTGNIGRYASIQRGDLLIADFELLE